MCACSVAHFSPVYVHVCTQGSKAVHTHKEAPHIDNTHRYYTRHDNDESTRSAHDQTPRHHTQALLRSAAQAHTAAHDALVYI
jgi:hypothetical protein